MKALRALLLVAAVCGLTLSAYGDDFRMNVLDPPSAPASPQGYKVNTITTTDFSFSFKKCAQGELPLGLTADGCFAGTNDSGETWTSLEFSFMGNAGTAGQTPNCDPAPGSEPITIFQDTPICTETDGNFLLSFTDGSVLSGAGRDSIFFITETGVKPPKDFPDVSAVAGVAASTPEPNSFLLLLTGAVLLGGLCTPRFRRLMHLRDWADSSIE